MMGTLGERPAHPHLPMPTPLQRETSKRRIRFRPLTLILAIAGLFLPSLVIQFIPKNSWTLKAADAHQASLAAGEWKAPWIRIHPDPFSSAWIPCPSIEDALALDSSLDDGWLFSGKLRLAEGGLVWIP